MRYEVWVSRNHGRDLGVLVGHCEPIAYTKHEGGKWFAIPNDARSDSTKPIDTPAAFLFEDGMVHDFILDMRTGNPWRPSTFKQMGLRPTVRVPMGQAAS